MPAPVSHTATAVAHPNIALVKYWGKRAGSGNLPAVGSLSITLDTLATHTEVSFDARLAADTLTLNGAAAASLQRTTALLDVVRQHAGCAWRARVISTNNFPTGAGLASSASGFAALAVAATAALQVQLAPAALSILARDGSGSAARSIFGGFAEMRPGTRADGSDAFAVPVLPAEAWPLRVVVAITSAAPKDVGSTDGMERTRTTAPYYQAWIDGNAADVEAARAAVANRDFARLGEIAEHSCLKMHAVALAAQPALIYWNPVTLAALQEVTRLRRAGVPTFFTIDAGPQVKAVCLPEAAAQVAEALRAVPGVREILQTGLGPGAHRIEAAP